MKAKKWIFPIIPVIFSCGGGDFGSGLENEFSSVILYVSKVEPQPLQSDVVYWYRTSYWIRTVDPNVEIIGDGIGDDDGICESNEVCCGDVGPGYQNFQQECCVGYTQVNLCIGQRFADDFVNIEVILEPKKDFTGQPLPLYPSPVIVQYANIYFNTLTAGCPNIDPISQSVNMTIQPNESPHTIALSLISQSIKSYIFSSLSFVENVAYVNNDGCITDILIPIFDRICEYKALVELHSVEIFSGDAETLRVDVSVRIGDFKTDGDECDPTTEFIF